MNLKPVKIYYLALLASCIILLSVLVQCRPSTKSNSQEIGQEDTVMFIKASELDSIADDNFVDEPIIIVEPKMPETAKAEKNSTKAKPTPEAKPIPIDKPITVDEPKPKVKPIPKDETISIVSSGFTLKLLKATIAGTSTLHDWESKITIIEGKGVFQLKDKKLIAIQDVEIKIAVKGIKSKEGEKMDDKTYETFESETNPYIIYAFNTADIKVSASNDVSIDVAGKLSMAGTNRPLSLSANGTELANGDLLLTVSKKIKMTDFNMVPPVMFLGAIKVGDEITVSFDFELTKLNN